MGKGDKKTRRGKIFAGSHGNVRPHAPKSASATGEATANGASEPGRRVPARKAPGKKPVRKAPAKESA